MGISIEDLAAIVFEPLRAYCQLADEYHFMLAWRNRGDSLPWLLQEELGLDNEPATDLAHFLYDSDLADPRQGDDPFFSSENEYHRRRLSSGKFKDIWDDFCHNVKHESRFFSNRAKDLLDPILGAPESATRVPHVVIGPDKNVNRIFRARRAHSPQELSRILEDPRAELSPPPLEKASAGRMNSCGIPVFYGAFSEDTAIAEVRPSVGGLVVLGTFKPVRNLTVLDLSRIGVQFTGSIFAPDYEARANRSTFLESFHALIAKPVQPNDELLEYIPTQAVAEYVRTYLGVDGILYASAQIGSVPGEDSEPESFVGSRNLERPDLAGYNVVLFRCPESGDVPGHEMESPQIDSFPIELETESVTVRRVTQVQYTHEPEYVRNPSNEFEEDFADVIDF